MPDSRLIDTFDLSPLDEKVTLAERFTKENRGWLLTVVYLFAVACAVTTVASLIPGYSGTPVVAAILFGCAIVLSLVGMVSAGNEIRLRKFADRNGLINRNNVPYEYRPGTPFQINATQKLLSDLLY